MSTSNLASRGNARAFIAKVRGSCGSGYEYYNCIRMAGLDKSFGDITPIYCPDETLLDNFVEVASVRGADGRWSSSLTGRMPSRSTSTLRTLAETKCKFDLQVHFGSCTNPTIFNTYDKVIVLEGVLISNYSTTELTAVSPDERGIIEETVTISAAKAYEVYSTELIQTADTIDQNGSFPAITEGKYTDCDDCGNCQTYFGLQLPLVCNVVGNSLEIFWTLDSGETWDTTTLPCTAFTCTNPIETYQIESDGFNLYITFNEGAGNNGHLYIVPISEVIAGTISSSSFNNLGNTLTIYDTHLTSTSLWIAGTNGIVYKYNKSNNTYSLQTNTTLFTNTWHDLDAIDDNNVLVGGASGLLLAKVNGSGFILKPIVYNLVTITDRITIVRMNSAKEWLVGTVTGELYCTTNGGSTWSLVQDFGGCIAAFKMVTANIGYLVTKDPARVFRTLDAGNTFAEIPDTYGLIGATTYFTDVVGCQHDPNKFFVTGRITGQALGASCWQTTFVNNETGIILTGTTND